jgi:hypothetical protein
MPFKPEVKVVNNGGKWSQNALVFATREEAEASARDLFDRWTATEDHRAVEVDDTHVVNYRWVDGHLEHIGPREPSE